MRSHLRTIRLWALWLLWTFCGLKPKKHHEDRFRGPWVIWKKQLLLDHVSQHSNAYAILKDPVTFLEAIYQKKKILMAYNTSWCHAIYSRPPINLLWFDHLLLMERILHQLRLVVYPIIYKVLYIPGGAGFLTHQQHHLILGVPSKNLPGKHDQKTPALN